MRQAFSLNAAGKDHNKSINRTPITMIAPTERKIPFLLSLLSFFNFRSSLRSSFFSTEVKLLLSIFLISFKRVATCSVGASALGCSDFVSGTGSPAREEE